MAQENRHLTNEQLSAFLDEQLSALEQSQLDAHLKTCEPCQQELTDLRRTVALLHALPRPALPRSFVLPLDIEPANDQSEIEDEVKEADRVPVLMAASSLRHVETGTAKQTRRWPTYARVALRTVSAIAAVIGLVLFLSGVLTSLPHGAAGAGYASQSTNAGGSAPQDAQVASSETSNNNNGAKPAVSPSSLATITPPAEATPAATPPAEATSGTTVKKAIETPAPVVNERAFSAEPATSQAPVILFFDLSTGPGRLGFGFLLLLLGVMGYVVFKRRWRQEHA